MKKLIKYISLSLLIVKLSINNVASMILEEPEHNFENVPSEIALSFIEHLIKLDVQEWNDIFSPLKEQVNEHLSNISLTNKRFYEIMSNKKNKQYLSKLFSNLEEKKFQKLFDDLMAQSIQQYGNLSETDRNKRLVENLLKIVQETWELFNKNEDLNKVNQMMKNSEIMKDSIKLILSGADPNLYVTALYVQRATLLHLATEQGNSEIIRILINAKEKYNYKIKLDAQNYEGKTALIIASELGYADIVKMLIKAGANLKKKDYVSMQPAIIHALMANRLNIVEILVGAGEDVNSQEQEQGVTPFILAALYENVDLALKFALLGAKLDIPNLNLLSYEDQDKINSMIMKVKKLILEKISK